MKSNKRKHTARGEISLKSTCAQSHCLAMLTDQLQLTYYHGDEFDQYNKHYINNLWLFLLVKRDLPNARRNRVSQDEPHKSRDTLLYFSNNATTFIRN